MHKKIITIFGLAGTGTSTCGKLLAEKLGYDFLSTGNLIREMAKEKNMDLHDFEELMKKDKTIDLKLDQKISELGKESRTKGLVIDSRLAWHFIPHSFKIKFKCDDLVRINRVAQRDQVSFEEAKIKIEHRENIHKEKFKKLYGIDNYENDDNFDFIVESSNININKITSNIYNQFILTSYKNS